MISFLKHSCLVYLDGSVGRVGFSFRIFPKSKEFQFDWVSGPWASLGPFVQFHIFDERDA